MLFSMVVVPVYIPTNSAGGFPFLHILSSPAFVVCGLAANFGSLSGGGGEPLTFWVRDSGEKDLVGQALCKEKAFQTQGSPGLVWEERAQRRQVSRDSLLLIIWWFRVESLERDCRK